MWIARADGTGARAVTTDGAPDRGYYSPTEAADVAISPDGRYLAWSYVQYTCPVNPSCTVRYATGYTLATKLDTTVGAATQYHAPSWVGSSRTLQSGGYDVQVMRQNRQAAPVHWFDDHEISSPDTDLADADLSRNGNSSGW